MPEDILMRIRPLRDRVVVRRVEEDERTPGGILIPDTAKEKPMLGTVVAVGPGVRDKRGERIAPHVQEGDTVLFGRWSGTEVTLEGSDFLILAESDLMGVAQGYAGGTHGSGKGDDE
jgi:chaperonin GroES